MRRQTRLRERRQACERDRRLQSCIFWLIMTSLLTGSVAFAGFVIAAETYRSYKEKEEQTAQAEMEVKAEPIPEEIQEGSPAAKEEPVVEEPIAPAVTAKQEQEEAVVAPVVVEKVDIAPIVAEEVKPE